MKSALIVVDMQQGLFQAKPVPDEADAIISRINRITARTRESGQPVIFTLFSSDSYLPRGSEEWKLHEEIDKQPDDILIHKSQADPFIQTNLEQLLCDITIERLLICGYASEICVDTSVRRAVGLGYKVVLLEDAHTTQDKPHLSAKKIRQHHNLTLAMSPSVTLATHDMAGL
jgi:nicotinamidase-related amidase